MKIPVSFSLCVALSLFVVPVLSLADSLDKLRFHRPIIDNASLLSSPEMAQISQLTRNIHNKGGPQIGIVILKTLGEDTIENTAIKIAEKWQLGDKAKDNGVLIVLASSERKMRIEVGNGIEGGVTRCLR